MSAAAVELVRPGSTTEVRFALLGGSRALATAVRQALCKPLGFAPEVRAYPDWSAAIETREGLIDDLRGAAGEAFLLPVDLEFGLFEKDALGQAAAELRRAAPALETYYDDVSAVHPLLVDAFAEAVLNSFEDQPPAQGRFGVLLVASGQGDAEPRARMYALMRLLWERVGAAHGEVAFLRHTQPFAREALERLDRDPLEWVVVPAMLEKGERLEHLRLIVDDHRRAGRASQADGRGYAAEVRLVEPPCEHPALVHRLAQRALELWRSKRRTEGLRTPSAKREPIRGARRFGELETGVVADVRNAEELRAVLPPAVMDAETTLVKVTWHGYAAGTYTDPVALDALLAAIPGRVVLLEGHAVGRNEAGRVDWDWESESREHREWIRAQENEYLERTGLAEVIRRHHATYLNVTEEFWDGRCARPRGIEPDAEFPELAGFVPAALAAHAGAPLISFARFKGPTRLSLANLFGLIPEPLRARWHGPNITYLARVCCALARMYGSLFDLYGVVESINCAVRWDRRGLYRSRWGNYDLIQRPGLATVSRGVAGADVIAARLQGQDPRRSAYYDVVESELGLPVPALDLELPEDWARRFA